MLSHNGLNYTPEKENQLVTHVTAGNRSQRKGISPHCVKDRFARTIRETLGAGAEGELSVPIGHLSTKPAATLTHATTRLLVAHHGTNCVLWLAGGPRD
jgi:hypothetical protein